MKHFMVFVIGFVLTFTLFASPPPSMKVTNPFKDDVLCWKCKYSIEWERTGPMHNRVKIELFNADSKIMDIVQDTANDGQYDWTVPPGLPHTLFDYYIHVTTLDNAVSGGSWGFFILSCANSSITVTSPATGNSWCKGQSYSIQWTKSGMMHSWVKIRLYQGATKILNITDSTYNGGSFNWLVPNNLASGGYIIRVKTTDNLRSDDSNEFGIKFCIDQSIFLQMIQKLKQFEFRRKGPRPLRQPCWSCPAAFDMRRLRTILERSKFEERVTVELHLSSGINLNLGTYSPRILSSGEVKFSSIPDRKLVRGISERVGKMLKTGPEYQLVLKNAAGKVIASTSINLKEKTARLR